MIPPNTSDFAMKCQPIVVFGVAGLVLTAAAGCNLTNFIGKEKATRTDNFTIPIPAAGKCVIRTVNGQIRCVVAEVSEISVEANVTARAATVEEAENRLEQITVERSENAGIAEIAVNVPRGVNGSASLTVTIPSQMNLDLHTSNGAIDVAGVTGAIAGVTSNGSIRIVDCVGSIDVKSSNGKVTLKGESLANVKAKTTNGTVQVDGNLSPGIHEIQTSNGSIKLALSGTPAIVTARTSNGSIKANGRKIKKGARTVLGIAEGAELASPGDAAELSLTTSNGSVTVTHSGPAQESPEEGEPAKT
jgi:DUF4097 and DUF4098 domain-containing protein YvlB